MRNFYGRQERWPLSRRIPIMVIVGLLALPLGSASADILYVSDFSNESISVIDTDQGDAVVATISMGFDNTNPNLPPQPLIPWCIAVTPDGTRAYITTDPFILNDGGNVYIIDTEFHTVSGDRDPFRIPPQLPPGEGGGGGHPCVVISPDGTRAYLSSGSSATSEIVRIAIPIPTEQNPPVAELFISTGGFLTGRFRLSPDGSKLYAFNSTGLFSELLKIDGVDGMPQSPETIDVFSGQFDRLTSSLAFTTINNIDFLYVTNGLTANTENIQVLNTVTNEIQVIPLPGRAAGIAMTPDGKFAYVALLFANQVVVIDTVEVAKRFDPNEMPGPRIVANIPFGGGVPINIAMSADGSFAYVTDNSLEKIRVINTEINEVDRTIAVVGNPFQIAILPSRETDTNEPPVALCRNVTEPTDPGVCTVASASVDNGSSDPDEDPFTLDQAPPGPYNLGDTLGVTLTATDDKDASDSCMAIVTVEDNEQPSIFCPDAQTLECTGPGGATASFSPTATDNCSVADVRCSLGSGIFLLGINSISCSAKDGSGNPSVCGSTVTVQDTTPPTLSAQWVPLKVNKGKGEFRLEYSAVDVCDPASQVTGVVQTPALDGLKIKLKTKREVKVKFDLKKGKVEIRGPDPQALLDQLEEFGGLVVHSGQLVRVELRKAKKGKQKKQEFKFDDGKLKIKAPSAILKVTGEDASGNTATVQVSLQFAPKDKDNDRPKKRRKHKDRGKDHDKDDDDDDDHKKKKKKKKDDDDDA